MRYTVFLVKNNQFLLVCIHTEAVKQITNLQFNTATVPFMSLYQYVDLFFLTNVAQHSPNFLKVKNLKAHSISLEISFISNPYKDHLTHSGQVAAWSKACSLSVH